MVELMEVFVCKKKFLIILIMKIVTVVLNIIYYLNYQRSQLMSFDHKDFWMPMDTNREYIKLNNIWKKNPKNKQFLQK